MRVGCESCSHSRRTNHEERDDKGGRGASEPLYFIVPLVMLAHLLALSLGLSAASPQKVRVEFYGEAV